MWFGSLGRLNGQPVLRKQVHIFEGKGIHIFMLLSCTVSYLIFPSFNDYQFLKARKRRKKVPQKLDKVKYRNFFSQSVRICHLIIENGRPGVAAWTVSEFQMLLHSSSPSWLPACPAPTRRPAISRLPLAHWIAHCGGGNGIGIRQTGRGRVAENGDQWQWLSTSLRFLHMYYFGKIFIAT